MAVDDLSRRVLYVGDGSSTEFAFNFVVFVATDVAVYTQDEEGEDKLISPSNYTVTLNENQDTNPGGVVVFNSAPADEAVIAVVSAVPETQPMVLTTYDGFDPEVLNKSADRAVSLIQQLSDDVSRAIRLPRTSQKTATVAYAELVESAEKANEALALMGETITAAAAVKTALESAGDVTGATPVTAAGTAETQTVAGWCADIVSVKNGESAFASEGGTAARSPAERFSDVTNAKDFGAKGDGIEDDTVALNAALTAAAGKRLYVPAGTFLTTTGLRIPSNTTVAGAGIGATIIKLADSAPSAVNAVTNAANQWNHKSDQASIEAAQAANSGNANICLKDLTVDGNGRREVEGYSGCAVQFCNVDGLIIENVEACNGRLHCIDIASAAYAEGDIAGVDYYVGASQNVTISNAVCHDSVNDDALTTHFSHDINIYSPKIYRTVPIESSSSHGLELDDGTYRVNVYGGHVTGYNCGLQVKAHQAQTYAPHDIQVNGLTCEGNLLNFWITHSKTYPTGGTPIRNLTLTACTSVNPTNPAIKSGVSYYASHTQHLYLCDVSGGTIENFRIVDSGQITNQFGAIWLNGWTERVKFTGLFVEGYAADSSGVVYAPGDDGAKDVSFENTTLLNCLGGYGWYLGQMSNTGGRISIDEVRAVRESGTTALVHLLYGESFIGKGSLTIRNVSDYAGYAGIVGETVNGSPGNLALVQPSPDEAAFTNGTETLWQRANTSGGNAGTPTITRAIGYAIGSQNVGYGDGVAYGFRFMPAGGASNDVAYVGATKYSGTDADLGHHVVVATRTNTDDAPVIRWTFRYNGMLWPATDGVYSVGEAAHRASEIFAATGTINTSDERLKQDITEIPEAVLEAWGEVQFVQFRFKDSVERKGDNARLHCGLIAQRIKAVFDAHGLDAFRYGLLCHDAWEADEGHAEAGDRYSIRYDEALALECAYQRWRLEKLEEKLG